MTKVFIDGKEGTTGLKIDERFAQRRDVTLLQIDPALRKDPAERRKKINESDVTFLCLPDAAAIEAASLAENPDVVLIDTSTAHRTAPGWAYGFPELSAEHQAKIQQGKRIAVPGCHASGFVALVYPLVAAGILPTDTPLSCFSLTGYSGGGKKMIEQYQAAGRAPELDAPRPYGLNQAHKHLPEMQTVCHLSNAPIFTPIVDQFYSGMVVSIPLWPSQLPQQTSLKQLHQIYQQHYDHRPMVRVQPIQTDGFLAANALSGKDYMEIILSGNDERVLLSARFDNLGKGASGAAIQCMNLVTGQPETQGLVL